MEMEYDFENICRSCLYQTDDLKSIFDRHENSDEKALDELLMTFAQVQVRLHFKTMYNYTFITAVVLIIIIPLLK